MRQGYFSNYVPKMQPRSGIMAARPICADVIIAVGAYARHERTTATKIVNVATAAIYLAAITDCFG